MATLVEIKNASAGYDGRAVLHDIDLHIGRGERTAVMGRSGAGKSTLLNLLYTQLTDHAALIPQAASLVRTLSVFHNVYMGRLDRRSTWHNMRTLAWPARADVAEIESMLGEVGLAEKLFAKTGTLSGGQQQRTSVARAMYAGFPVVVGDEPVSALDRLQGAEVLRKLCARHETVVLAMHDIQLALTHTDRIIVLDQGRIVLDQLSRELTAADLVPYYGG